MNFGPSSSAASNDGINNSFQRLSVTQISPTDIRKNFWTLQKTFISVNQTGNVCLNLQHASRGFSHFGEGVALCEIFSDIGQKFVDRSKIVLARECLVRLEASAKFVRELEDAVENYTSYLESERAIPSGFPFKVDRFHDICHTAKSHCMYRVAIAELISSDPWLGKCVPDMRNDLKMVTKALSQLAGTTLSLISNILSCVLRLAEKCRWDLSQQDLSSVCQGIEDFNRLFEYATNFQNDGRDLLSLSGARDFLQPKYHSSVFSSTAVRNSTGDVYLLTLNKVLNGVACERSRILAGNVHKFVSEHQEVSRTLKYDFAANFEWKDFGVVCTGGNMRLEGTLKNGVLSVLNRNQIPLLKLDPDSPLLSCDSQEQKFFSNLISQLATSTTLILGHHVSGERKNVIQLPPLQSLTSRSRTAAGTEQDAASGTEEGGVCSSSPSQQEGHGILRHTPGHGSPRLGKRVQWHAPLDSETSMQLQFQYSSVLWSSFGEELLNVMSQNPVSFSSGEAFIGPLFLWPDFLLIVVMRMMESLRLSGKYIRNIIVHFAVILSHRLL